VFTVEARLTLAILNWKSSAPNAVEIAYFGLLGGFAAARLEGPKTRHGVIQRSWGAMWFQSRGG